MPAIAKMLKLVAANLGLAVGLLVAAELALGDWFGPEPLNGEEANCTDTLVHHFYCRGVRLRRYLSPQDGGHVVHSYIDKSGIAVASGSLIEGSTDPSLYDIVNIGDSFLEAQAVPYDQRLAQHMRRRSANALQVGYSSWAPITMLNWLRANPVKRGAHVNLFVMTNDFTPGYGWANINYYKHLDDPAAAEPKFKVAANRPRDMSLARRIERRSFMWSRWNLIRSRPAAPVSPAQPLALTEQTFAKLDANCEPLASYEARKATLPHLLLDYLYFARPRRCWTPEIKAAVDHAVVDIRRIGELLRVRGATLTVLLIPAGWAFPGESLPGKGSPAYYGIAPDVTVTQAGLAEALQEQLAGLDFVDLEAVIADLKRNDKEAWYLPFDSHWTGHAQARLADWLLKRR